MKTSKRKQRRLSRQLAENTPRRLRMDQPQRAAPPTKQEIIARVDKVQAPRRGGW